jgi:putative salt-induced outer membrane protein
VARLPVFVLACAFAAPAASALAAPIPAPVEAMIDAAAGDPGQLKTVSEIAKQTNPDSVAEIDARVAAIKARAAEARQAELADQDFMEGWSGQGQAGGSFTTGNTEETGVVLGLNLKKESLNWRHRLNAVVDYKTSNNIQTRERYFVGYEGDYRITDRLYSNLLVSWEKDPFAGVDSRFSESLGIGYRVLKSPAMNLDLDAGIAARQTRYMVKADDSTVGARAGMRYEWRLNPDLIFSQIASVYVDSSSNTLDSTTALTTKLSGALSGRASFNVRYESDPPAARETTDTSTRFSLVYAF